jgi:hypothetical protein
MARCSALPLTGDSLFLGLENVQRAFVHFDHEPMHNPNQKQKFLFEPMKKRMLVQVVAENIKVKIEALLWNDNSCT